MSVAFVILCSQMPELLLNGKWTFMTPFHTHIHTQMLPCKVLICSSYQTIDPLSDGWPILSPKLKLSWEKCWNLILKICKNRRLKHLFNMITLSWRKVGIPINSTMTGHSQNSPPSFTIPNQPPALLLRHLSPTPASLWETPSVLSVPPGTAGNESQRALKFNKK